jgi:SAM-dependent methyltransferase
MIRQETGMADRTSEELRQHYEVEKELGDRLRRSSRAERAAMYSQVYDELFRRVPKHPQWTKKNTSRRGRQLEGHVRLLQPYLSSDTIFLEVGAGDCALPIMVAPSVRKAYGLEVSEELTRGLPQSEKFEVVLSKGCEIPLPANSIDLAYSFQVVEHIHADDVVEQLKEIYRVLKPGGRYYCITPNRINGPHDISRAFDHEATGLHLKEYSVTDLLKLFRETGFRRVWIERMIKGHRFTLPILPIRMVEAVLESLPWSLRLPLSRNYLMERVLHVSVMGQK